MTSKWTYDYIDIYFSTVVQSKILYIREISDKQIIYRRNAPNTVFVQEHSRDYRVFTGMFSMFSPLFKAIVVLFFYVDTQSWANTTTVATI